MIKLSTFSHLLYSDKSDLISLSYVQNENIDIFTCSVSKKCMRTLLCSNEVHINQLKELLNSILKPLLHAPPSSNGSNSIIV